MFEILKDVTLNHMTFRLEKIDDDNYYICVVPEEIIHEVQHYDEGFRIRAYQPNTDDLFKLFNLFINVLSVERPSTSDADDCYQLLWKLRGNGTFFNIEFLPPPEDMSIFVHGRSVPDILVSLKFIPHVKYHGYFSIMPFKADSGERYFIVHDRTAMCDDARIMVTGGPAGTKELFENIEKLLLRESKDIEVDPELEKNLDLTHMENTFRKLKGRSYKYPYVHILHPIWNYLNPLTIDVYHPELFPQPIIFGFESRRATWGPSSGEFYNAMKRFISDDFDYENESEECYETLRFFEGFPLIRNHLDELFEKRKEMYERGRKYGKPSPIEGNTSYNNNKDKQTTQVNSNTTSFFS